MSMMRRILMKISSFVAAGPTSNTAPCRLKKQLPVINETVATTSTPLSSVSQLENHSPTPTVGQLSKNDLENFTSEVAALTTDSTPCLLRFSSVLMQKQSSALGLPNTSAPKTSDAYEDSTGSQTFVDPLSIYQQTRNYQWGSNRKPNPLGREASVNFKSNANYGEDGCTYCDHGKCTLKVGDLEQQPKYRTSPDGYFPCLYCDADFKFKIDLQLHQEEDHPFLFCPRAPSKTCDVTTCDVCANTYHGKEDDHDCPSPANK